MPGVYVKNSIVVGKIFLSHSLCVSSPYNFLQFDKLNILGSISDSQFERHVNFSKLTWLTEHLLTQKSISTNYSIKRVGRNDRRTVFSINSSARKIKAYNFFYFFTIFVFPYLNRKLLRISQQVNFQGDFFFVIKDVSAFPGYLEMFFKWPYSLFFQVKFRKIYSRRTKHIGLIYKKYILQDFGFKIE